MKFNLSHKLRAFKNKLIWKLYGSVKDEAKGGWAEFYDQKIHHLFFSHHKNVVKKSRKIKWMGCVERIRDMRNAYKILIG
jgi:hypothetical protein